MSYKLLKEYKDHLRKTISIDFDHLIESEKIRTETDLEERFQEGYIVGLKSAVKTITNILDSS